MTNSKFITDFKQIIIDRLNDYKGTTTYGCDLAYKLFEGENANGSVLCNTYATKEFIKENFDLFGDLVELVKNNTGEILNPFLEPEKAHVILYLEAAYSILSKVDFIEKKWDKNMTLTEKAIKTISRQINELDIDEEDLF